MSEGNEKMKSITTAVQSFFGREEIRFEHTEFDGVFKFGFIGESGCFRDYVAADEDKRTVQVQTLAPLIVPRGKRLEVAELLMRVNQHLVPGTLELNMDRFFPAINAVLFGNISPKHAIDGMRRRQPQPDNPDDRNPHESFRRRLGDILRGSMN